MAPSCTNLRYASITLYFLLPSILGNPPKVRDHSCINATAKSLLLQLTPSLPKFTLLDELKSYVTVLPSTLGSSLLKLVTHWIVNNIHSRIVALAA